MHWLVLLYVRPQHLVCASLLGEESAVLVQRPCHWEQQLEVSFTVLFLLEVR